MNIQVALLLSLIALDGIITIVLDRRIAMHEAAADFNDRYFKHRVNSLRLHALFASAVVALKPAAALWSAPLYLLTIWSAHFPLRKRLFAESWSLFEFLFYRIRLIVGTAGYWILIALTPLILRRVGADHWEFVLATLLGWSFLYQYLMVWLLDSAPLADEDLLRSMRELGARATVPMPRIYECGPTRGRWANAVALPNGRWSRILFTRTVLRELSAIELTAVFAHEIAHVEQWSVRKMTMRRLVSFVAIPLMAIVPEVVLLQSGPSSSSWFEYAFPSVIAITLALALARRQHKETEADVRAVALGADPEALISALEKLHDLNKMPRRFDAAMERRMTHPSLLRRAVAIRRAAGTLTEEEALKLVPRIFRGASAGTFVRFNTNDVEIFDGVQTSAVAPDDDVLQSAASRRAFAYSEIATMDVRNVLGGVDLLLASGGGRFTVRLKRGSLVAAREAVRGVRAQSGTTALAPLPARRADRRLLGAAAILFAFMPGVALAVAVPALLTLIFPVTTAAAALAATTSLSAVALLTKPEARVFGSTIPLIGGLLAVIAILFFLRTRTDSPDEQKRGWRFNVIALGVASLLASLPLVIAAALDHPLMRVHLAAQSGSAVYLLGGLAAALATHRRLRIPAAVAGALAVVFLIAGTNGFAQRSAADPLVASIAPYWIDPPAAPVASRGVAEIASAVRLSPGAQLVAFRVPSVSEDDDDTAPGSRFFVSSFDGPQKRIDATDLIFTDDHHYISATDDGRNTRVTSNDVSDAQPQWTAIVPRTLGPTLENVRGKWQLAGFDLGGHSVRYSELSGAAFRATSWRVIPGMSSVPTYRSNDVLYASMFPARTQRNFLLQLLASGRSANSIWSLPQNGRVAQQIASTLMPVVRFQNLPDSRSAVVFANDDRLTHVSTIDDGGRVRPVGTFPGRVGRISAGRGLRIAATTGDGSVVVWNIRSNKAFRFPSRSFRDWPIDVAFSDHAVVILRMRDGRSFADLYSTDPLN